VAQDLDPVSTKLTRGCAGTIKNTKRLEMSLADSSQHGFKKPCHPAVGYEAIAKKLDASYFKFDNWNEIIKTFSHNEITEINLTFIDQQLKTGKQIFLSHSPYKATGAFLDEVLHLEDLGYRFEKTGSIWKVIK